MFWVWSADNTNHTLSSDDDAFITDFLNGWTNFHREKIRGNVTEDRNDTIFSHSLDLIFYPVCLVLSLRLVWSCIRIWFAECDTSTSQVVWSQLDCYRISWNEADKMFLHLTTDIRTNHHIGELLRELNFKDGSRKGFEYLSFNFDFVVFWHVNRVFALLYKK